MTVYHFPQFYCYRVGFDCRFKRPMLNKYPGSTIGASFVVNNYAYCIKWGWAR